MGQTTYQLVQDFFHQQYNINPEHVPNHHLVEKPYRFVVWQKVSVQLCRFVACRLASLLVAREIHRNKTTWNLMAILAINCFNWMIQNLYMETCWKSAQNILFFKWLNFRFLFPDAFFFLPKFFTPKRVWVWCFEDWQQTFNFPSFFLEDEGTSNSFLAALLGSRTKKHQRIIAENPAEAPKHGASWLQQGNTNLQHKLKNAWTLQWKGEWTCISPGCFGVLKMTPLDWGGNRILRVLYFPNLNYIRLFLGGFPLLNDLFGLIHLPRKICFFPASFSRSAYAKVGWNSQSFLCSKHIDRLDPDPRNQ